MGHAQLRKRDPSSSSVSSKITDHDHLSAQADSLRQLIDLMNNREKLETYFAILLSLHKRKDSNTHLLR